MGSGFCGRTLVWPMPNVPFVSTQWVYNWNKLEEDRWVFCLRWSVFHFLGSQRLRRKNIFLTDTFWKARYLPKSDLTDIQTEICTGLGIIQKFWLSTFWSTGTHPKGVEEILQTLFSLSQQGIDLLMHKVAQLWRNSSRSRSKWDSFLIGP